VRYADDCNVYVRSRKGGRAGDGAAAEVYAKLKLKVNEAKSAVASVPSGSKFLGYSFWFAKGEASSARWPTSRWRRSSNGSGN
jgi:RNA-directed DNA polymerase